MLRDVPVTHVPGIGPAKAKVFAELGIHSVDNLIHYYPRAHEDRRIRPFEAFEEGRSLSAKATVDGTPQIRWKGKNSICSVPLRIDGRHRVLGVWFNQPYLKSRLVDGQALVVTGRFQRDRMLISISHTEFQPSQASQTRSEWTPVYRVTKGITSNQLQGYIAAAIRLYGDQASELLPQEMRQKYRLLGHMEALQRMHFPVSEEDLKQARRRLAFEEFFLFQLQLQYFRANRLTTVNRQLLCIPDDAFERFRASLPYPLTNAQRHACQVISDKLQGRPPMSLLLQGDVGSGKTWVALWSAYAVCQAGDQTALMAPTEILAEQHYREAVKRLEPLGVRVALLTSGTAGRDRRKTLDLLSQGSIDVMVGTHALLTHDVEFASLRLVITDEQHRFGVQQRSILRKKGVEPDVLFLSATPIPRTLALAVYGDLDVAILDELPAGRQKIETYWWPMRDEQKALMFLRKQVASGRQAFVVAPLVEESTQAGDIHSATELFSRLTVELAGIRLGLLHGRMNGNDKEAVMADFLQKRTQVLVSTTVIEVGIDVPEATVMLVYHADRFGLAQLHQLRGRVGRGQYASSCILLADAAGEVAKSRLQTMVETQDGFVIAERDLALRGPGEFLGVRQSGLPEFSVGDLARDLRMMEVARDEALNLVQGTDFWLLPKYEALQRALSAHGLPSYQTD